MEQGCRLCIEPRKTFNRGLLIAPRVLEVKADSLRKLEGSRPGYAMASVEVTTGVRDQGNWNVQELIQLSYKLGLDMNLIARKSGSALKIIIISWMEKRGFTNDPAKAEFDRLMDKKISMEYPMESIDMKINRQIQKDYDNLLVKIRQQRDDGPEKIGGAAI